MSGPKQYSIRRSSNKDVLWRVSDTEKRAVNCLLDQSHGEALPWDDLDAFSGHEYTSSQRSSPALQAKTPSSSKSKGATAGSTSGRSGRFLDDEKSDDARASRSPSSMGLAAVSRHQSQSRLWPSRNPNHDQCSHSYACKADFMGTNSTTGHLKDGPAAKPAMDGLVMYTSSNSERMPHPCHGAAELLTDTSSSSHRDSGNVLFTSEESSSASCGGARRPSSNMRSYEGALSAIQGSQNKTLFNNPGRLLMNLTNDGHVGDLEYGGGWRSIKSRDGPVDVIHHANPVMYNMHHDPQTYDFIRANNKATRIRAQSSMMLAQTYCAAKHLDLEAFYYRKTYTPVPDMRMPWEPTKSRSAAWVRRNNQHKHYTEEALLMPQKSEFGPKHAANAPQQEAFSLTGARRHERLRAKRPQSSVALVSIEQTAQPENLMPATTRGFAGVHSQKCEEFTCFVLSFSFLFCVCDLSLFSLCYICGHVMVVVGEGIASPRCLKFGNFGRNVSPIACMHDVCMHKFVDDYPPFCAAPVRQLTVKNALVTCCLLKFPLHNLTSRHVAALH
jgi:hypothetical protein